MIDLQASQVAANFAIDAAGVTNLYYPFQVRSGHDSAQPVSGNWQISAVVAASDRGTHMSRFIEGLEALREQIVDPELLLTFANDLRARLQTTAVSLAVEFHWFKQVKAPVTGIAAMQDHLARFAVKAGSQAEKSIFLEVAAKSLCPCSKAISERGAHNQRSLINAKLDFHADQKCLSLSALSDLLQTSGSSPVYPILKRADEKFVTEAAFDNPAFVEDIARNVANKLVDIASISRFEVNVRNLESIHGHDCFARIMHPKDL